MSNNYSKYYDRKPEKQISDAPDVRTEEPALKNEEEAAQQDRKRKIGTVVGCRRLNVRKGPSENAEVIGLLSCGDSVEILENDKGGRFVRISTADIRYGYCMREYIK